MTAQLGRLGSNAAFFRLLERRVQRAVERQRWHKAVAGTQAASEFASKCHPGTFVSLLLEGGLDSAAAALLPSRPSSAGAVTSIEDVLHVMTKTPFPGGHTTWVRRWVERDTARTHSLVVTEESADSVAGDLRAAIEKSGGEVLGLAGVADPVAAAAIVRQLSHAYDAVVLSTHPWDVVPSLAFSFPGRRPVIRLDHADHRFWIGCAITDVIVEYRPVGERCSRLRRGIAARRQVLAPLPIDDAREDEAAVPLMSSGHEAGRGPARRQLGIEPDAFVVLSIGSAYKFERMNGLAYLDYVVPAIRALPQLLVIAIGPTASRRWAAVAASTRPPGRLRPVGPQRTMAPYLAAADAFLNPIPIGSETAMWEAAMAALPIICVQPASEDMALVTSDPEEFEGAALTADSPQALLAVISRLHHDPDECRRLGATTRQVALDRSGAGWRCSAEQAYAAALALGPASLDELSPRTRSSDIDNVLASMRTSNPLRTVAASEIRAHPRLSRGARSAIRATSRWRGQK